MSHLSAQRLEQEAKDADERATIIRNVFMHNTDDANVEKEEIQNREKQPTDEQ